MKKRIIPFILVIIMTVLMVTPAFAIVAKTDEFYVADYANVLSESTEQEIIDSNGFLENACSGAQIVVVAVEYLDGMYSDEYAMQVMNDWEVGDRNGKNGMVLVFATKENKGWLMQGDGIDAYFTDNMADDHMNDYFWGHYDNGKYDKAVQKLFPELVEWYEDYYNVDAYGGDQYYYAEPEIYVNYSWIFIIVIFFAVFIFIAVLGSRQRYRSYYVHMGMPIPRFHFWHMWRGPHRHWHDPHRHHHHHTYHHHHTHHHHSGPRGPHGPSSFGGGFGGSGRGGSSSSFRSSGRGGGGRGSGGGGGRR